MNLKPDEVLLECTPTFVDLPDGEYGKGLVFSGNAKYDPLHQFISRHDPMQLRVFVEGSCVLGLICKQDPWVLAQQAKATKQEEPVAVQDEPEQNPVKVRKGPFGRPLV